MLTAHSSVENRTAAGTERVNIQTADEAALKGIPGISSDLAKAIINYRNQNRFESIVDLLDVTQVQDPAQQAASGNQVGDPAQQAASGTVIRTGPSVTFAGPGSAPPNTPQASPQPQPAPSGPKLISPELFMDIADDVTAGNEDESPGVLNVNSASLEALICLPGMSREMAQAIISFRQSNGYLPNIAHLLKVPGITQEVLKQLAPRITARSETYRILSEGRVSSTGARQRIEEIVHVGWSEVRTLAYRENDL
jgi:competence ComEA-like helix-hairpin-helix protein